MEVIFKEGKDNSNAADAQTYIQIFLYTVHKTEIKDFLTKTKQRNVLFEYYISEKVLTTNRKKYDIYINTKKTNFQSQFPKCTAQLDELTASNIKPMKLFIDWEKSHRVAQCKALSNTFMK